MLQLFQHDVYNVTLSQTLQKINKNIFFLLSFERIRDIFYFYLYHIQQLFIIQYSYQISVAYGK